MKKGYIQLYTGNGKGKTTAALGLSLRNICAGGKVYFGQFMKGQDCSELKAPEYLPGLTMEQYGTSKYVKDKPSPEDIRAAEEGFARAEAALLSGQYDLIVLDEINTALFYGLLSLQRVLELLDKKPEPVELVLTGRYAPSELIDRADLVTEMKEIKHYYKTGVLARRGIEY